jgi:hypothetical protein
MAKECGLKRLFCPGSESPTFCPRFKEKCPKHPPSGNSVDATSKGHYQIILSQVREMMHPEFRSLHE